MLVMSVIAIVLSLQTRKWSFSCPSTYPSLHNVKRWDGQPLTSGNFSQGHIVHKHKYAKDTYEANI